MKKIMILLSMIFLYGTNVNAIKVVNDTKLDDVAFEVSLNQSSVGCVPLKLDAHGTGTCEVEFFVINDNRGNKGLRVNVHAREVGKILPCKTPQGQISIPVISGKDKNKSKDIDQKTVATFSKDHKGIYSCIMIKRP